MTTHSRPRPGANSPAAQTPAAPAISPLGKAVISGLLLLHVAAVFIAPFSFASRVGAASSPFADGLMGLFRPYVDAMFLNHGYFFFAPNPGETHLVRYRVEFADGREPLVGTFPDLEEHWPRLLYHRHFMMAEALHSSFVPAQPPPEPSPPPADAPADEQRRHQQLQAEYAEQLRFWRHRREQYEALRDSLANHLKAEHDAASVTLTRVEHRNLFPNEMSQQGKRLDAPDTYRDLPEILNATSN